LVRRQVLVQCLQVKAADLHLSHSQHKVLDLEVFQAVLHRSEVVALERHRVLSDQQDVKLSLISMSLSRLICDTFYVNCFIF
jgi:hypothetical protein